MVIKGPKLFSAPFVHAGPLGGVLLTAAHEQRAAAAINVGLGQ